VREAEALASSARNDLEAMLNIAEASDVFDLKEVFDALHDLLGDHPINTQSDDVREAFNRWKSPREAAADVTPLLEKLLQGEA